MLDKNKFPLVSVIFITYKRIDALKKTYKSFTENCDYPNLELIVTDDGSPQKIQDEIKKMKFDVYCLSNINRGLGYNQNQGLYKAKGKYILHIQDDWEYVGKKECIQNCVNILESNNQIDFIRLWKSEDNFFSFQSESLMLDDFSVIKISGDKSLKSNITGDYVYSDRPHLKRKSVHNSIGYYNEEILALSKVELDFCKRFEESSLVCIYIEEYVDAFVNFGENITFNIDQKKENFRRKINSCLFIGTVWRYYVYIKYGKTEYNKWLTRK